MVKCVNCDKETEAKVRKYETGGMACDDSCPGDCQTDWYICDACSEATDCPCQCCIQDLVDSMEPKPEGYDPGTGAQTVSLKED